MLQDVVVNVAPVEPCQAPGKVPDETVPAGHLGYPVEEVRLDHSAYARVLEPLSRHELCGADGRVTGFDTEDLMPDELCHGHEKRMVDEQGITVVETEPRRGRQEFRPHTSLDLHRGHFAVLRIECSEFCGGEDVGRAGGP